MAIADGMRFQYGSYLHPYNEVRVENFEIIPHYSPRGLRMSHTARMTVSGEVQATGQEALTTAIAALRNAYQFDNKDAGLLQGDGVRTPHFLETANNANLTPVRVVHRSWPSGQPDEYFNARRFSIVLEAEYKDSDSELLEFHESVEYIGDGMEDWTMVPVQVGLPRRQQIFPRTPQLMIQHGYIVGASVDPIGSLPPPLVPAAVQGRRTRIRSDGPQWRGSRFWGWKLSWTYFHLFDSAQNFDPNRL